MHLKNVNTGPYEPISDCLLQPILYFHTKQK